MKSRARRFAALTGLALAAGLPLMGSAQAADSTEVVTAADVGAGDWFTSDTRPPGTGTFESGPATPPAGTGSFELRTPTSTSKVQLFTDRYDNVALSTITALGYSSYLETPGVAMVALNLRVDLTGDGNPDAYMVYEPYQDLGNAAIQLNTWQTWDAYRGGAAKWWLNTGAGGCGQATPCTWSTILAAFPGATIQEGVNCGPGGVVTPCPGSLGFNQGSGNAGAVSNGDKLVVGVSGNTTTFDFEVIRDLDGDGIADTPPPTNADQCKKGGYAAFNNPSFKNQGQCVSYVNGRR